MSFVALAGQDKAILIVSRGANFSFLNCFLIHPNSKMTAKKLFFYRQAGTHVCCGFTVNDLMT